MFRRKRDETASRDQRLVEADRRYVHNRIERSNPGALINLFHTVHPPAPRRKLNGIVGR